MILTKTPLRVSLVGGGTDLYPFYHNHGGGKVVSFTINKYVYILVNKPMEDKVRVSYSKTENVKLARDVEHELVRACLKKMRIHNNIEIVSVADIPGSGSGLGSSSAFTVGLLNALTQFKIKNGMDYWSIDLAEEACDVEIEMCGKPIGKQDQYACAYGGFNMFEFHPGGDVEVRRIGLTPELLEELNKRLMLFYTGITRPSDPILREQNVNIKSTINTYQIMEAMRNLAQKTYEELLLGNISCIGDALYLNWSLKKQLADGITNDQIDDWYNTGLRHGAVGGKVLGAGGGGFMLFYVPKDRQKEVLDHMPLKHVPFKIVSEGSRVIYPGMEE